MCLVTPSGRMRLQLRSLATKSASTHPPEPAGFTPHPRTCALVSRVTRDRIPRTASSI